MANIFDYLVWRGDVPFSADPFNEVDNLVLSWLSYVNFEDSMPCGILNEEITIQEAGDIFFKKNDLEASLKKVSLTKTSALLLHKIKDCRRFNQIRLSNYVNHINEELQKQFSAMTFRIDENTLYIAFRGTDDTIVGWREDFNMSFLPSVPSQEEAVMYLKQAVSDKKENLILGGHSKGGNLAVYSAIHSDLNINKRILQIYNNDGPGFLSNVLDTMEYKEMLPKIKTIVPESSIIGMLLGHEEEYEIVKSDQKGIMQHDASSWQVIRNEFVYLDSLSNSSKFLNHSFKEWVFGLNEEQRRTFVDALFQMLEAAGAKTTGELYSSGWKSVSEALKVFGGMDTEMKQKLLQVTKSLFDIMSQNMKASLKPGNTYPLIATANKNNK